MHIKLSDAAVQVLEARYLRRSATGEILEAPEDMFLRVSRAVATAETAYHGRPAAEEWAERYFHTLAGLEFLPNSPVLMNAGLPNGMIAACFVLPVQDDLGGIFDALRLMALIQQAGGGTGFSFSRLRPSGDVVGYAGHAASGPVSFMRVFDCATENVRLGGRRRGANMGVLSCHHPDILEFIEAKLDLHSFRNFNLSVALTDRFMEAVENGAKISLINPRTGETTEAASSTELFERISRAAWTCGDPGVLFLDAINRANPTPGLGAIESTNPCGEVPLLPYEACVLGSINLARMTRNTTSGQDLDWERLAQTVRLAVRFLDDTIDVGCWPDGRIARATSANRKIGVGIMGWAELLMMIRIPYGSGACLEFARDLMAFINDEARRESERLAIARGPFPNWSRSVYAAGAPIRNATRIAIAPTGSISIIADTSAGIEPIFARQYRRHLLNGRIVVESNPLVSRHGTNGAAPRTALDLTPKEHMDVQEAFQRHVDSAVSKTINLPQDTTPQTVAEIYRDAWRRGLKGVTVYRYGSREQQVFELPVGETIVEHEHAARCDPEACKI